MGNGEGSTVRNHIRVLYKKTGYILVYGNVRSLLLLGGSKICHSSRLGLQGSNICRGVYIVS